MPLDPSIILGFKPTTALADPLDQTAKALQIRNEAQLGPQRAAASAQALQSGQQQLQAGAQDIQAKQLQMAQNAAVNKAYADAFTVDPATGTGSLDTGKLSTALAQGGHGAAIPAVIEATTKAHKAVADLAETQGKVNAQQADTAGSIAAAVRAANFDPHLAITLLQNGLDQKGLSVVTVPPIIAHLKQLLQDDPTGATAGPEVKALAEHLIAQSPKQTELDTAAAAAAARKLTAETGAAKDARMAPGEKAASDKLVADQNFSQNDPLGLKPEERARYDQADASQKQAIANQAAERREAETRNRISQSAQDLRQRTFDNTIGAGKDANGQPVKDAAGKPLTGDALLATLTPGRAAQVKAFAEGRETQLPRGAAQQPFLDLVNQYDPTFNNQRAATRNAFAPGGKSGQNIQSLNTATVHLDQLGEAAKAMDNGSFRPGNSVFNSTATMFGSQTPTNFEGVKAAVASEMASALKGNATDQEIAANAKTISEASSPKQLAGIVDTNLHVLGAKLNTKDEEYQKAIGPSASGYNPVLPTAQGVFDKHGIQPIQRLAKATGGASGGTGITTPTSQAQYDALPKGAQFKKPNDQTVYTKQ